MSVSLIDGHIDRNKQKMADEVIKALERLKSTKDYLRECYQEDLKKCKYPELKPLIKDTYEDNKKAFDIAIKAIEDFNRQQAEIEKLQQNLKEAHIDIQEKQEQIESLIAGQETLQKYIAEKDAEIENMNDLVVYNANCATKLQKELFKAKTEAVKEFAERLKRNYEKPLFYIGGYNDFIRTVDNLVKEMAGDAE